MIRALALVALLALTGCDKPPETKPDPPDPIGRYQMLPGPEGGVYVLDTQDSGWIRYCHRAGDGESMLCGADAHG